MKKKAVIVSGYFNPLHRGHLEYFNLAKELADELFVIINNDHQRDLKGSKEFQKEDERLIIVSNIKSVDKAILSIDNDRTVCKTIRMIVNKFGEEYDLAFANGGDQNNDTIPERLICEKLGVILIDGLGNKIQSSSWLLKNKTNMFNNLKIEHKTLEIEELKCHEYVVEERMNSFFSYLNSLEDDIILPSIIVCRDTHTILDGHHRYHALKKLKIPTVTVTSINYEAESVITHPSNNHIKKADVIASALNGDLMKPKTTKHMIFDSEYNTYKPLILIGNLIYIKK